MALPNGYLSSATWIGHLRPGPGITTCPGGSKGDWKSSFPNGPQQGGGEASVSLAGDKACSSA